MTKVACFSLVVVGMLLCHGSEDNEPADMRILFIGNSFTAFGDMPGMVEAILEQGPAGIRVKVERSFSGGKTLKWHWEDEIAPEKIRNGKFDVIVLQASSRSAYPNFSACVFSAVLSGKSPADSPVRGPAETAKRQPKLDDPMAEFLQSTAWKTFQTYEQKGDVKVRIRSK